MKRFVFIMMSALLLSAVGCLESSAKVGVGNTWRKTESPSYANMRPLENMSADEAISIMKTQFFFQEEYGYSPWVVGDNYVFDNCDRYSWTFLYANSHWQWAVKDLGNGKCQIEPYHEWYEHLAFEDWYYQGLSGDQLCHIVIDYGEYYDGYTPPTDPLTAVKVADRFSVAGPLDGVRASGGRIAK